ncbi:Os02g0108800 [Oryza sativa Japonica Group]|uniref:Os02g0108800 protein n=1 Tax=Oryza sativa subsp. japonica TaxID=39947 RepID=Q0E4N3_ORYSJ|nr:Os02g0108800 [Oryza sativa Japonica Group]|eukprot:NP_001045641.1 Os02g0108800 [Oryza sativa Japonica Group]
MDAPRLHQLPRLLLLPGDHQEALPQPVGRSRGRSPEGGRDIRPADQRQARRRRRRRRPTLLHGLPPPAARGRGRRPAADGRRDHRALLRVPQRRHRHDGDVGGVDHGRACEPPRHPGQGPRRGETPAGANRGRPAGDAVPQGRGAGGPPAAPAGAVPAAARRAERRGGRRLRGAQGRGAERVGGGVGAGRGGVDGGEGVHAGEVHGRRRGGGGRDGEQGDNDDAVRRGAADVPRVHGGDAARGVPGGEPGEGAGVAAGDGGGGGGHGGGAGFHHRHEAPAPCSRPPKALLPLLIVLPWMNHA